MKPYRATHTPPMTQLGMELTKATKGEKKLTSDGAGCAVARMVTTEALRGDGDAGDGLAVGGVGAAAEESARHGADAVAQQGAGQAGILQQVVADDGGDVLVVGDVLGEDDEGDRHIGHARWR